ncbi:MAG: hypothetical protein AAF518_07840 [Spirochaetota bacterium]
MSILEQALERIFVPIRAFRLRYLPLLLIYFSYGASGFSQIAESFWVKEQLRLNTEALLSISVWAALPWTIKMVFGELGDSVPIFGSKRKVYVIVGASLIASAFVILAGLAGNWPILQQTGISQGTLYLLSSVLASVGFVFQDVMADAMSTEVIERTDSDGNPREEADIQHDLGMVQLLGRLSLALAMVIVAGLGGWLTKIIGYENIFLCSLFIPCLSILGVLLVKIEEAPSRPVNWRILLGGTLYGSFAIAMGFLKVPYSQEIIFIVSLGIIIFLLSGIIRDFDKDLQKKVIAAIIVIFTFRAMPGVGPGYSWWAIDVLHFDPAFFGTLRQTAAIISILVLWLFADTITKKPINFVLFWLTVLGAFLSLPNISLFYGIHNWTEQVFGFGARTIALLDTAAESPLGQISMIPLLTLIAIYAPKGNASVWFSLMSSLLNLALVASQIGTKYLNKIWVVSRASENPDGSVLAQANYSELGYLLIAASILGFVVPCTIIYLFMPLHKKT